MKYDIKETAAGLAINAHVPPEQQSKLLEEFNKCANGTCSCPSTQYNKLAAIDVQQSADGVNVALTVKAGEVIDKADIQRCLDHTVAQVK